ncbi:MAG: NAD(P)/FAD-dependent oxidoreductase, partial [bacterium]|nr:NAD(P)/FAD-dependent oxidoreductase [bacterium]
KWDYDKLILTAGSHPFVPPFPGVNKENVSVLRTKGDADGILGVCRGSVRCVCIGGGLLGLETAGALARRGVDVTILEGHGRLLPRQLNREAGELMEAYASSLGIKLRKGVRTREIIGDERVRSVLLDDGTALPAELVVIATGVRSNSYLARLAGLEVNHGIIVDDMLRTSCPDVYAAGDIAEHRGVMYGTWGPSQFQGTMAGLNAAGVTAEFVGIPRTNMLKVLGYDLFSIGRIFVEDASYEVFDGEVDGNYFYFVFRDGYMVGAILLGDTSVSAEVKTVIEKRRDCSEILKKRPAATDILSHLKEQP